MLKKFLENHPLANLTFALVIIMGIVSYFQLPRERSPNINFNWIQITTAFPGASAQDVEKRITDPLEDAINKVSDIKFISSNSREGLSSILVRFNDVDAATFDKRLNDLHREVQNAENTELPDEAKSPFILEITSSNAYPSATLIISSMADDENLRRHAYDIKKALERLKGVDRVDPIGLHNPEIQIRFLPQKLLGLDITPSDLANTVQAYFRDTSAGTVQLNDQQWLVRLIGTDKEPGYLARLPIFTPHGEVPLGSVAEITRTWERPRTLAHYNHKPAVQLAIMKKANTNVLDLVDRINHFVAERNDMYQQFGIELIVADDQTVSTREAIRIMEGNAIFGLILVLLVTWLFLGSRISILVTLGIPFSLAGTFWLLKTLDQSLNNSVLLGVVIALGMLVDDAVVVVEAIYYRLRKGVETTQATLAALKEVFAPVTTSVLTTVAAFLPLMLLPGILGKFMMVIPMVVSLALLISLIEAYWMLPAHIMALKINFARPSAVHPYRVRYSHWLQVRYIKVLAKVMRRPLLSLASIIVMFILAVTAVAQGLIRLEFFAMESYRLFYVTVEMPAGTTVEKTLKTAIQIEDKIKQHLSPEETRALNSYAGVMFTETEPFFGDQYGQVMVSLNPQTSEVRTIEEIMEAVRQDVMNTPGPLEIVLFNLKEGPPVTKPINIKVRGNDYEQIKAASDDLRKILNAIPQVSDISDDLSAGRMELVLRLNSDAVQRTGLNPVEVARILRLMVDGDILTNLRDQGEKVELRLLAKPERLQSIEDVLDHVIAVPNYGQIALRDLAHFDTAVGEGNLRHYNLRRAITIEAQLNKKEMDTVTVNKFIKAEWDKIATQHPTIDLDFTGELDDIQESMGAMQALFLLGIGLIYLILGTQFRSYLQPLMILSTVPMAFTGVVLGLLITGHPLSLYTMYGVVALAGVAVNAAIVLISAANDRREAGMGLLHATLYAARRRLIPILITALTTIAGLFSLATGLAGHSPVWGPVATAMIWGLGFSTALTLFVIPLLYQIFMTQQGFTWPGKLFATVTQRAQRNN